MQIAIHQPNYFPWLGYFAKMHLADKFLFLDTVQFSKGSYTNRCQVFNAQSGQKHWLTIPLIRNSSSDKSIRSIQVNESIDWRSEHLRKIEDYYCKARFFTEGLELVTKAITATSESSSLSTINSVIIKSICRSLHLNIEFAIDPMASGFEDKSTATDLLVNIVKAAGGDTYISGSGGRKYLDEPLFQKNDIELKYSDFGAWVNNSELLEAITTLNNGCSVIDAVMKYGTIETREVLSKYKTEIQR